jgi:hypothetical protein
MITDSKQITINTERLDKVEQHIEITNKEIGQLRDTIIEVKTDVKWIRKIIWWIIPTMIAGFTGIFGLLIQHIMSK